MAPTFLTTLAAISAALLLPTATAQDEYRYTVWASVIFSRSGERTPEVLGSDPITLTSLGANQQLANGQFFRQRYLESYNNFTNTNGISNAPLVGLDQFIPDVQRLYVQSLDEQPSVASAQAFLQGLYPPVSFASNASQIQEMLDPTSRITTGNTTYLAPPLNGYRYAQIHAPSFYDPEYVYVGGSLNCPAFGLAVGVYNESPEFILTYLNSRDLYKKIGPAFLSGVMDEEDWQYANAYAIYDYLSYQNAHNSTAQELFASSEYAGDLDKLRYLSNQQLQAWFARPHAENPITGSGFVGGVKGGISTIAGNMLAAKMLGQLQTAVNFGGEYYQLSLLFGDYEPLLSLFNLMELPMWSSDFLGIPDWGSVGAFELYSNAPASQVTFPAEEDLYVQFFFRNGSDSAAPFRSYSLFGQGPDGTEMRWVDFQYELSRIAVESVGEWCQQCGADLIDSDRVFCAYWNTSDSRYGNSILDSSNHAKVSPVLAGVIGAIVTLVFAGLLFGLLMLLAGVRFHRVHSHKSDMGGFKGSQKLASDRDLTLPKGGAVVGATVETPASPVAGGHERVGSWELKQQGGQGEGVRRPSFEDDDLGDDVGEGPWKGVKPHERV